jgi:hypothetical protein
MTVLIFKEFLDKKTCSQLNDWNFVCEGTLSIDRDTSTATIGA